MTGGVWRGRLTYFDKSDLSSPVASDGARRVSGAGPAYGVARAIASGARVINVSLGIDWLGIGHPLLDQVIVVGGLGYSSAPLLWRGTRTVGSTLLEGSNGGNLVDLLVQPSTFTH